jgi:hypothetical protein
MSIVAYEEYAFQDEVLLQTHNYKCIMQSSQYVINALTLLSPRNCATSDTRLNMLRSYFAVLTVFNNLNVYTVWDPLSTMLGASCMPNLEFFQIYKIVLCE